MRKMTNTVLKTQLKKKIEEHQALLDEMLKGEGLVHVDLKLPVTPAKFYFWNTRCCCSKCGNFESRDEYTDVPQVNMPYFCATCRNCRKWDYQ